MQKKHPFSVFIFYFFIFNSCVAQLSGIYTIGGANPNFPTIDSALINLSTNGVSGPVIFNFRPGVYYDTLPVHSYYVTGVSNNNTITLQSETLDSSSVKILCPKSASYFSLSGDANYFIFKEITFSDSGDNAIDADNITILNSIITTPGSFTAIEDLSGNCMIENSFIWGDIYASRGNCIIENSRIAGGIYISFGSTTTLLKGDTIWTGSQPDGEVQISADNALVEQNIINENLFSVGGTKDIVRNNIIYAWTTASGTSVLFENNKLFPSPVESGTFELNNANSSTIIDNAIYGSSTINYGIGSSIISNKMYGGLSANTTNCYIINNIINIGLQIGNGSGYYVYNNSFSPHSQMEIEYAANCTVENNNFSELPISINPPSSYLYMNNNYFPSAYPYDPIQTNFNPEYTDTVNLHANNPLLISKGIHLPQVIYDIDSILRPYLPTIGANEICISSDTINIPCGDSVILSLCSAPLSGTFTWSPNQGLNKTNIRTPNASPSSNIMYILQEAQSGYKDSVFINVTPYKVKAYNDTSLLCGDSAYLFTNYNTDATYIWLPNIGLSNSTSWCTVAKPSESMTYTLIATVNGCGVSEDSIRVNMDSIPNSIFYYSDTCNEAVFYNYTGCGSKYHWDFGDSTTSAVFSPTHNYDTAGNYLVTLISCNNYGCDTLKEIISIPGCPTSIPSISNFSDFRCYPNPSTGIITIETSNKSLDKNRELSVFNIYSEKVFDKTLTILSSNYPEQIDLSAEPNGVYILRFTEGNDVTTKKIIILK